MSASEFKTECLIEGIALALLNWMEEYNCKPSDFVYTLDEEQGVYKLPDHVPAIPLLEFRDSKNQKIASSDDVSYYGNKSPFLNECYERIHRKYAFRLESVTSILSRSKLDKLRYVKINDTVYDLWHQTKTSPNGTISRYRYYY